MKRKRNINQTEFNINEQQVLPDQNNNTTKKPENLGSLIKRTVLVTSSSCLSILTIFGFACGAFTNCNKNTPSKQEMQNNIMFLDPNCDYISSTSKSIIKSDLKFLPAQKGSSYVILDKNITSEQSKQIKNFLNDLNFVFTKINPNYKFEILEDYSLIDKLNANTIVVKNTNKLTGSHAAAHSANYSPTTNGIKTVFNRIYLNPEDDFSKKYSEGCLNFAHEFMHVLGVDDNYDKDSPYYETIMGYVGNIKDNYFSINDLYILKCKYGKIDNLKEATDYIKFSCEYLNLNPEYYMPNERYDNFYKRILPNQQNDSPIFTIDLDKVIK